jgi:hypothetical protein
MAINFYLARFWARWISHSSFSLTRICLICHVQSLYLRFWRIHALRTTFLSETSRNVKIVSEKQRVKPRKRVRSRTHIFLGKIPPKSVTLSQIPRAWRKRRRLGKKRLTPHTQSFQTIIQLDAGSGGEISQHHIRRRMNSNNREKSHKIIIKQMIFFTLISHASRYPRLKDADHLLSEITIRWAHWKCEGANTSYLRMWSVFPPRRESASQLLHHKWLRFLNSLTWPSLGFSNGVQDTNCLSKMKQRPLTPYWNNDLPSSKIAAMASFGCHGASVVAGQTWTVNRFKKRVCLNFLCPFKIAECNDGAWIAWRGIPNRILNKSLSR